MVRTDEVANAVLFFVFGGLGLVGNLCGLGLAGFVASFLSNPAPPPPGQPNFAELWTLLDRRTGRPIETFGEQGRVDLRKGLGRPFEAMSVSARPGRNPM
jgi:hypothetical protein